MLRKIVMCGALTLLLFLDNNSRIFAGRVVAHIPQGFNPGPDIITGNIDDLTQFGSSGTQVGLAVTTTVCNAGNVPVDFFPLPQTNHPIIPQNLYRMSGGTNNDDRFEQIGQSWVKHTFGADQRDDCFACAPAEITHLGVGCSDTYFSDQNADQDGLGSRALVNPYTGVFLSSANDHGGHTHSGTSHRILVEANDLLPTLNAGATYYAEVQYITAQESNWCQSHPGQCNMYNNSSYRGFTVSGTSNFTFSEAGATVRMNPAIRAWAGATITSIEPAPGLDGRAFIGYKVTGPVGGIYHYEYAIFNENLDRAIQSFSLPLGCGTAVTNLGFHAPLNHPGFPNDGTAGGAGFSNTPWTADQTSVSLTWRSETLAQNPNANAIRWGTLYNFRFDSDRPPFFNNAMVGFFKTGTPVAVGILMPNSCNGTPAPTASPTATPVPTTPPPTPTASPSPRPVPTPIQPPGGNGKIVYNHFYDIYVMNVDGTNQTNLTNDLFREESPSWSPDGTKIVFMSSRQGGHHIWVMNADGSNPVHLTNGSGIDYSPRWSPDGTKIVFVRYPTSGGSEIYVMNANGSNQVELTSSGSNGSNNFEPAWSPDGGKIAFISTRGGTYEIYLMEANGANQIPLTDHLLAHSPAWSPDGTKIIFDNIGYITVMSAYGENVTRLTHGGLDSNPVWSPDETKIAFTRYSEEGEPEVYVMDSDGGNQINLSNTPELDSSPDWQRVAPVLSQAVNLSTRMRVDTGGNVGVGGFIISGTAPKHVLLRAIGPSLGQLPDALANPVLELHGPAGFAPIVNDNWRDDPAQEAAILATGIQPVDDLEAAIDANLNPGSYTAVVRGNNGGSGTGLVEIYDFSHGSHSKLANLSTRAFVGTSQDVVIAGITVAGNSGNDHVVARGLGPSLTSVGVTNPLGDPTLTLRNVNGDILATNNNWQDVPAQAADVSAAGLAPSSDLEAAIGVTLPPGPYTALLSGMNSGTGVGLVEIYDLGVVSYR